MSTPELHPEKYRSLLTRRGEPIRWFRSEKCSGYNPQTGSHDLNCAICGGKGRVYVEQTGVSTYRAAVRGVAEHKEYLRQGLLLVDDVQVTTMPDELPLGEGDLILLETRSHRFSETVVRGAGPADDLRANRIASVVRVWKGNTEYVQGTDFSVQNALEAGELVARLVWSEGRGPGTGETYTATYRYHSVYQVLPDIGVQRRVIDGVSLPQRVFARLKNPERMHQ